MAWTDPRTWTPGEVVTAAMMNTHVRDNLLVVGAWDKMFKGADTSTSSDATVNPDPDLQFPVAAGEDWIFFGVAIINVNVTPGIRYTFAAPAGASGHWYVASDLGPINAYGTFGSEGTTSVSITDCPAMIGGVIENGGNAGTLSFSWAQVTSNATATIVRAHSYLLATRI